MSYSYLAIIIALAIGVAVGWFLSRARKRSSGYSRALSNIRRVSKTPPSDVFVRTAAPVRPTGLDTAVPMEAAYTIELRANLKQKVLGNEAVVERLIQYERAKDPNGHMELWVKAAIDRWEHDNRSHR